MSAIAARVVVPLSERRKQRDPSLQGDASAGLLLERMQATEAELDAMQNEWADAEEELVERTKQVERLKAPQRLLWKKDPPALVPKPTKEDLDALVLDWLWREHPELMEAQLIAEAKCAGFKVVYKCAERSLSSKQSRLNADLKLQPR